MVQSTNTAERDARILHDAHHESVNPNDIAVGVIIGRTSEAFDFFVYAIAAVIVFPTRFFPFVDPLTGTLYSFAIFALAFLARPFGTLVFTEIDRRLGKSAKLTLSLFILGTCTVAIGLLPAYDTIGAAAIWILALLRIGQGIALAGSWDGLASLLAVNAPDKHRGWYAMIPQLGAPIGLVVASTLFAYFVGTLSAADFYDWGWRYPFFVAFAINVVALFARLRIVVTPEYTRLFETEQLNPSAPFETVRTQGTKIIVAAFAPLASFALFHMVTVFPLSYVFLYTDDGPSGFLIIEAIGAIVGIAAVVMSGVLADRVGRRTLLAGSAVAIAAFSGFAPQLLDAGTVGETIYMVTGFVLLGLSFGQSSGALASRFETRYRYTASSLTSDLAWLFGAGFAPLAGLLLAANFGLIAAGAYLLSGAVVTLIALYFSRWEAEN